MVYGRELAFERGNYIHGHTFDGTLPHLHLAGYGFVNRQIIDSLLDAILTRHIAQFGRKFQIDTETVADLAFKVKTAGMLKRALKEIDRLGGDYVQTLIAGAE